MKKQEPQYSIWLMPKKEVYVKFATIIEDLSDKYDFHAFQPHVTVLGDIADEDGIDVVAKAEKLATGRKPFDVQLASVDYQNEFSKCLFVKAETSRPLYSIRRDAMKLFGIKRKSAYMPHLSLMYGDYMPSTKRNIIKQIGKKFNEPFTADTLYVVHCSSKVPIEDWNVVKEIPFRSAKRTSQAPA